MQARQLRDLRLEAFLQGPVRGGSLGTGACPINDCIDYPQNVPATGSFPAPTPKGVKPPMGSSRKQGMVRSPWGLKNRAFHAWRARPPIGTEIIDSNNNNQQKKGA